MFDDLFSDEDFIIEEDDLVPAVESDDESWDTGREADIFATGSEQDLWTTK